MNDILKAYIPIVYENLFVFLPYLIRPLFPKTSFRDTINYKEKNWKTPAKTRVWKMCFFLASANFWNDMATEVQVPSWAANGIGLPFVQKKHERFSVFFFIFFYFFLFF